MDRLPHVLPTCCCGWGLPPQLSALLEPVAPSTQPGSNPKSSELCGFKTAFLAMTFSSKNGDAILEIDEPEQGVAPFMGPSAAYPGPPVCGGPPGSLPCGLSFLPGQGALGRVSTRTLGPRLWVMTPRGCGESCL